MSKGMVEPPMLYKLRGSEEPTLKKPSKPRSYGEGIILDTERINKERQPPTLQPRSDTLTEAGPKAKPHLAIGKTGR